MLAPYRRVYRRRFSARRSVVRGMSDETQNFDVAMPDIPIPQDVETPEIKDEFEAGFKFGIIGSGQGGSRLAETFHRLGYRRVCALNTAEQDLTNISIPEANKLCIGSGGAGKDPSTGRRLIAERKEDVLDFMRRAFGPALDRVIVCAGAGGGTGAGTVVHLVDIGIEVQKSLRCPTEKVGVVIALPKISEGTKVHANAYHTLVELLNLTEKGFISPLVIVDNEKIGQLYPSLAVDPFWHTANVSVCSLFHLFNTVCVRDSRYSTFDRNDFRTILDSGLITFGAMPAAKWQDATDISYAVRSNLKKNILSAVDPATGSVAGAVIIGGAEILSVIPQLHLDHAFEQLTRMLKPNSTVHRGIYRGDKPSLVVYTTIGGLGKPTDKLAELKQRGNIVDA
jgi:cell division GTPase FtsZ